MMGVESSNAQPGATRSVLESVEYLFTRFNSRSRVFKVAIVVNLCLIVALFHYFRYPYPAGGALGGETHTSPVLPELDAIPKKIWQVYLSPPNKPRPIDPKKIPEIVTWVALNPDYDYNLIGDNEMHDFLKNNWAHRPVLSKIFSEMSHPSMRSDLSRFAILATYGGVYSDTDVEVLRPIDEWIPQEFKAKTRVVMGIEFDRGDGPNWGDVHEDLQFVLWTVQAVPHHPIFTKMVDKAVGALEAHLEKNRMTWTTMKVTSSEVMKLTGPGIWTDGVYEHILESHPNFKLTDLSGMKKPVMIDDILILPIDGFGMGQPHSNSTNDGTIPKDAMVKHHFAGSWRSDKSMVNSK